MALKEFGVDGSIAFVARGAPLSPGPIHTGYVRDEAVAKIHPFSSFGRNMLKLTSLELNL